jgi:hypothetical protein
MKSVGILIFSLLISSYLLIQCKKAPDYPDTPHIELVSALPNPFTTGVDSFKLKFSFTDGDGDLGLADTSVFVMDKRTNSSKPGYYYLYNLPEIPAKGSYKQVTGTITVDMFNNTTCRPGHPSHDTTVYQIMVRDKAGHNSNVITTDPIIFNCL